MEIDEDVFYQNNPPTKPTYGRLASSTPCEPTKPRIGPAYQATVASSSSPSPNLRRTSCTQLWDPTKIDQNALDSYLMFVQNAFITREWYSEERALYFLSNCEYQIDQAIQILSSQEEDPSPVSSSSDDDRNDGYDEDDYCFVCGDGGTLLVCDREGCRRVYHLHCAYLDECPEGTWLCPSHYCGTCKKQLVGDDNDTDSFRCCYCTTSYCSQHVPPITKQMARVHFQSVCEACLERDTSMEELFFSRLKDLHNRRGELLLQNPKIGKKEVDLFRFYKEVIKRGGYHSIQNSNKMTEVREELGLPVTHQTADIARTLRILYSRLLYPFERKFSSTASEN